MKKPPNTFEDFKVLLVDDSFESLNLIRNMLKDLGVTQVYTAKNGMEALDFMGVLDESDGVDVILCDWNMPRMPGIDVLKQIRSCDPDLPFLMVTGIADHDSVVEAKFYGVTGYIKKPFSAHELKKKLDLVSRILDFRSEAASAGG
jgi:two-component system chemotaxis response regulator CheY